MDAEDDIIIIAEPGAGDGGIIINDAEDDKPLPEPPFDGHVVVENLVQEEENNNELEYITREKQQEAIIVESLSLPVEETAAANHRPQRNGEGLVELIKRKQFDNQER